MRWKIWRLWLLLRPLLEHLIGRRIGLRDYWRPVIMTEPWTSHLKRDFEDAYLGTHTARKKDWARIMEMVKDPSSVPEYGFWLDSPKPTRWKLDG